MPSALYRLTCLFLVFSACLCAETQGTAQTGAPVLQEPARLEEVPRVPGVSTLLRGFNAGVTFSGVHDSSIGWYTVATPAISYTFSHHYSADASLLIYPYRLVWNQNPGAPASQRLVTNLGDIGDTLIGLHASINTRNLWNTTTAYLTIPTGNSSNGLGAGKFTFDFSDHLERYVRKTGFLVDLGAGDSSGLFNNLVTRDYYSLGALTHYQAGIAVWLPGRNYIKSVAYEQLPIGHQTVYTTLGFPGAPSLPATSSRASEDNGITTSLGIPLTTHLMLSSYYNRSLRQHIDTVSIGVTCVLRSMPWRKRLSLIDRALREAEEANR